MIKRICQNKKCGCTFEARSADVKRGWAKFCSKSCKAIVQERKTGQHAAYKNGVVRTGINSHDEDVGRSAMEDGWDGHKNAF